MKREVNLRDGTSSRHSGPDPNVPLTICPRYLQMAPQQHFAFEVGDKAWSLMSDQGLIFMVCTKKNYPQVRSGCVRVAASHAA